MNAFDRFWDQFDQAGCLGKVALLSVPLTMVAFCFLTLAVLVSSPNAEPETAAAPAAVETATLPAAEELPEVPAETDETATYADDSLREGENSTATERPQATATVLPTATVVPSATLSSRPANTPRPTVLPAT